MSDKTALVISQFDKAVIVLHIARWLLPSCLAAIQPVWVGQVRSLLSKELVSLGAVNMTKLCENYVAVTGSRCTLFGFHFSFFFYQFSLLSEVCSHFLEQVCFIYYTLCVVHMQPSHFTSIISKHNIGKHIKGQSKYDTDLVKLFGCTILRYSIGSFFLAYASFSPAVSSALSYACTMFTTHAIDQGYSSKDVLINSVVGFMFWLTKTVLLGIIYNGLVDCSLIKVDKCAC